MYYHRWTLRPTTRNTSSYKYKEGDENGNRVYQVMLNSMQLLPITDISKITKNLSNVPQKRKADINDAGSSNRKKKDPVNNKKKATTRQSTTAANNASGSKTNLSMDTT